VKVKAKKRQLKAQDELGVDWERWADGRAWRLKRKRHFGDVDPSMAMEAAANAARRMGKAVQTTRDRMFPEKCIWVQFADGRIRTGDPCECGSRRLYRLHPNFLRCPQCHRFLLETESTDDDEFGSRASVRLKKMTGVHLARLERSGDNDLYRGFGEQDGQAVVVLAEFRAVEEEPVTPIDAYDRIVKLQWLPFDGFSDVFDVSALRGNAPEWDLVLTGDALLDEDEDDDAF
jgi:hypothetical protein